VASSVFGPFEHVIDDVVHPIGSWFSSIGHLGSYKSENKKLHNQVSDLQTQLRMQAREHQLYLQAVKLLHLTGLAQYTIVPTEVTAVSTDLGFGTSVTIDRGSANGITVNETVINALGLVGRVTSVGRSSATVELADNDGFIVGCRLSSGAGTIGQVTANGAGSQMTLQVPDVTTKIAVGEQLVTLGSGGKGNPYVPEVPIGTITKVLPINGQLSQTAVVKPFVNFSSLDLLAVVTHAPNTITHDTLLPHSPSPAPTVTVTVTATPGTKPSSSASSSSASSSSSSTP
jgi:rod shape-determining protein MreC